MLKGEFCPWNPYGVARLNLAGLLQGQKLLELNVPITVGPREPPEGVEEGTMAGPLGRGEGGREEGRERRREEGGRIETDTNTLPPPTALPDPLPSGDYLQSQSELKVTVELTFPLTPPHPSPPSPPHPAIEKIKKPPPQSRTPSRAHRGHPDKSASPKSSPSRALVQQQKPTTTCPFGRMVYVISSEGEPLVRRVISLVNEANVSALGLQGLPKEVLQAALSTYKLTK